MRRKTPNGSDLLTIAALAGVALWLWRRSSGPTPTPAPIATYPAHYEDQFTVSGAGTPNEIRCNTGDTLQSIDSLIGCYPAGSLGPLGTAYTAAFLRVNPLFKPPAGALLLP